MGKTTKCKVCVYDKEHNLLSEYDSKSKFKEDFHITTYKLDKYSRNGLLYDNKYYFETEYRADNYSEVQCEYCGKTFMCLQYRIDKAEHIYCSIECRDKALEGEDNCVCPICGKKFHLKPHQIRINNNNYCSRECLAKAKEIYMRGEGNHQYGLKGSLNASWKSDVYISQYGYRLIRTLDHPFRTQDDFVFEHRLVAEKYLLNDENSVGYNNKRYLSDKYVVHHIDFNRLNNDPSNLIVMLRGEHTALHMRLENDEDEFKKYCKEHNLDYETVLKQHIYNKENYSYKKKTE